METTRRVQKLRRGWLPVNSRESRVDPDRLSGCSACSPSNFVAETVDHLFQCESSARRRAILDRFSTLFSDFRVWKTSKTIIAALLAGALAWVEGRDIPSLESLDLPDTAIGRLTARAFTDQTSLGWNVLFRGFWASSWRLAQEEQFSQYSSRERQDTGKQWAG